MLDFNQCLSEISKIKTKSYCLIIGGHGTNFARSPKVWNKILKKNRVNCKMMPLEVKKNNLKQLLRYLNKDTKFLGGAVAVPYKEKIYNYLGKNVVENFPLCLLGLMNGVIAPYFLATFAIISLSVVTKTVPTKLDFKAYSIGYCISFFLFNIRTFFIFKP